MRNGERGIGVGSLWSLQCRRASKVGLVGVGVQVMFTSNLDQASNQKWGINVVLQKSIAVNKLVAVLQICTDSCAAGCSRAYGANKHVESIVGTCGPEYFTGAR